MPEDALRVRVGRIVDSGWFQYTVVAVIVLNAISLGLETYEDEFAALAGRFETAERVFVSIFVVELVLKIYARGPAFFRDAWNWFDLIVVVIALVPTSEGFSVLRLLRTLRILRLVSVIPHMRQVVGALFRSVPGMGTVISLLLIIIYTAAVLGEKLFQEIAPEYFGDLGTTLYTLFMVMTTENWPDVADAVMEEQPMAWVFFVVYMVATAFIALNLVIGVIVTSMEQEVNSQRWAADQELELEQHNELMTQLGGLAEQVERLTEQVRELQAGTNRDRGAERETGD
ncbi:ion transporter [Allosalinactinospora lopnorensis]|uniref:ion transporter n=1 Tax=Allosalinactinospora lopnorensis TaxID=1352348 RepID=UPI001F293E48|nr:ion transporter [Allosalinactinospora lopnorensis]